VWRAGLIDDERLRALAEPLVPSGYGTYLLNLLDETSGSQVLQASSTPGGTPIGAL
jgi:glucose-1-phosphate thymidylyltransferase